MKKVKDAGAASLKKVPTRLLKERIRDILGRLDAELHTAKLEANNRPHPDNWDWPDKVRTIGANLLAHVEELRGRTDRGW